MTIESACNYAYNYIKSQKIDVVIIQSKKSCSRYVQFKINGQKRKIRFSDHIDLNIHTKTFCISKNGSDIELKHLKKLIDKEIRRVKTKAHNIAIKKIMSKLDANK